MFDNVERVAAAVAGLCLFALNDARLLEQAAREAAVSLRPAVLQFAGPPETVFLSATDLASRWGLAGLTLALAIWALAVTLPNTGRNKT